jgi:hypothetical protein
MSKLAGAKSLGKVEVKQFAKKLALQTSGAKARFIFARIGTPERRALIQILAYRSAQSTAPPKIEFFSKL